MLFAAKKEWGRDLLTAMTLNSALQIENKRK
jgi:hypothetical protein